MNKCIAIIAVLFAGCCAVTKPTKAQSPSKGHADQNEHEHTIHGHQKPDPRVKVELSSSVENGRVTTRLVVRATGACTLVKARIVSPESVRWIDGDKEITVGAMKAGDETVLTAVLDVPPEGQHTIAGGADCTLNSAVTLNASTVLVLGEPQKVAPKTEIIRPQGQGAGLRLAPARVESTP